MRRCLPLAVRKRPGRSAGTRTRQTARGARKLQLACGNAGAARRAGDRQGLARHRKPAEAWSLADMFLFYGGLASELKGETLALRPRCWARCASPSAWLPPSCRGTPHDADGDKIAPGAGGGQRGGKVKSAEEAPLAVLHICELLNQRALPPGLFNAGVGRRPQAAARALVSHPKVNKVTFTGSVETMAASLPGRRGNDPGHAGAGRQRAR